MSLISVAALAGLGLFAHLVYSVYNLDSGAWKRQRRYVMSQGTEMGLSPLSEGSSLLGGELDGLRFQIGLTRFRCSKSQGYRLQAELSVPAWSGVVVNQEDLLSGAQRLAGEREVALEDPEVDACFWLEGQEETLRRLFTSPSREALLRAMPEIPNGELREGRLTCQQIVLTPFFVRQSFLRILSNFRLLAEGLQGRGVAEPIPPGYVAGRKLRGFALASLTILAPLTLLAGFLPGEPGLATQIILGIGLGCTLLALSGWQSARAALQGYYAFLTLAVGVLALAGAAKSWLGGLGNVESLAVLGGGLVIMALCWSARHYLRVLDISGVTLRHEKPRKSTF